MHYDLPALAILKATLLLSSIGSTWMVYRIEGASIPRSTVPPVTMIKRLSFWFLTGTMLVGVYIASIYRLGGYVWGAPVITGTRAFYYGVEWLLVSAIYGVADSVSLFGYPVSAVRRSLGPVPACVLAALGFSAMHVVWFDAFPIGLCALVTQGLFLCALKLRTGVIVTAATYAGGVFAQDFLFSVPDSGTRFGDLRSSYLQGPDWLTGVSAGPKASLSAMVVYALALLCVIGSGFIKYKRRTSPITEGTQL